MKLVPKPQGFEFRDKRSTKSGNGSDWTPADALYDASQRTEGKEVTQMVVYWWEMDEKGREVLRFSQSTTSRAEHAYLLQKALQSTVDS